MGRSTKPEKREKEKKRKRKKKKQHKENTHQQEHTRWGGCAKRCGFFDSELSVRGGRCVKEKTDTKARSKKGVKKRGL